MLSVPENVSVPDNNEKRYKYWLIFLEFQGLKDAWKKPTTFRPSICKKYLQRYL